MNLENNIFTFLLLLEYFWEGIRCIPLFATLFNFNISLQFIKINFHILGKLTIEFPLMAAFCGKCRQRYESCQLV